MIVKEVIFVNGIEVHSPDFICEKCDCVELKFNYLESNRSIQMRCANCGSFNGNYKYSTIETYIMPFGKHKGEKLIDIPKEYLEWLYLECDNLSKNLREAIENIIED